MAIGNVPFCVPTLNRIAWTIGPNRRATVTTTPIINNLLITPEKAEHLTETCGKIHEQRAVASSDTGDRGFPAEP